ncbi:MAG: Regulatory LuxR family protein [Subtercola sp.]|nr:Regulatory LuxR family protein [Subtercola sp.]
MALVVDRPWPILPRTALVESMARSFRGEHVLGVIVSGESGSGKTTLTQAIAHSLDSHEPIRLRGSELSSAIPYGTLYSLLETASDDTFSNPGSVFRAVSKVITERSAGRQTTVIVDSAHLVDELSAHALVQLASVGRIRLIVADSDFAELPEGFLDLWRDGLLISHVVPPLSSVEVSELLTAHLGGPLVASALTILLELSGGNPLHLYYLVLEQLGSRSLSEHEGVWVLANRVGLTDERLLGLLRTRLDRWTVQQREVLEFVALTEGIPFAQLDEITDSAALEDLLTDGIIEIVGGGVWGSGDERGGGGGGLAGGGLSGGGLGGLAFGGVGTSEPSVRITHRLVADVVRASVPFVRRRLLRTKVIPFYEDLLNGSAESLLAYAAWTLECGVPLEPEIALQAATLANLLYDPEFALRAAAGVKAGPLAFAASLQKSRAWRTLGMHKNAAQTLNRISAEQRAALTTAQRIDLAVETSRVTVLVPGEAQSARDALAAARDALSQSSERGDSDRADQSERLDIVEWSLLIADGRYREVVEPLELAYARLRTANTDTWVAVASLLTETLCTVGRQTDALEILAELEVPLQSSGLSDDVRDRAYSAVFITLLKLGLWSRNITSLTDGSDLRFGQELYRGSANASALGVNYLFAGRVNDGHGVLLGALGQVRVRDSYNSRGQILSALAYSAALADDVAIAEKYLNELGDGIPSNGQTLSIANYLALNALAVIGNGEEARSRMLTLATGYLESGQLIDEVLLLSSAARLGSPEALERLQHPLMSQPGPLADAIYEWARAVKTGDSLLMLHAAGLLHDLGNHLFAREAATRVAESARGEVADSALRMLGEINLALKDGPTSAVHLRGIHSLTKRERDVTALAAKGLTNREIAESLHLSVRTVESYLQAAFGKLGIGGRTELADAL